jgi:hypothetical protein
LFQAKIQERITSIRTTTVQYMTEVAKQKQNCREPFIGKDKKMEEKSRNRMRLTLFDCSVLRKLFRRKQYHFSSNVSVNCNNDKTSYVTKTEW